MLSQTVMALAAAFQRFMAGVIFKDHVMINLKYLRYAELFGSMHLLSLSCHLSNALSTTMFAVAGLTLEVACQCTGTEWPES